MRLATFNVNSIKVRLPHLLAWLGERRPDVVCLQELKAPSEAFPVEALETAGYTAAIHGQKSYNGVAILSRLPLEDVRRGLPGDETDAQARYIEAAVRGPGGMVRVASIYVPNGNPPETEKFPYKLAFLDRLAAQARRLLALEEPLVLAGDYNVIPHERDVYDPEAWRTDALFRPETRAKFNTLLNLGLTDAFRACHAEGGRYSFWDYQGGAWPKDRGMRIDHLLLSPQAADRLRACGIDRDLRAREAPSDHVPVWCDIAA